ncbi:MAG: phosphate/phosphite/phosphonate ABC transporter substrate-binding protein [Proteobacteria bacterium]|nr:phosphate/phosphite/phosphonate ABC transporter substrate-binding protein [Pseudomonadota bacterium]MBU1715279.1 phosphate/phosphite/phosphonate ABC transporter substrate-binding protein [Pseudomonadota bacterium]
MKRIGFGACLLFAVLTLMAFRPLSVTAGEQATYTMGIIPTWEPVMTHTQWIPFVERLAKETGLPFKLKVYETMADFERDIVSPTGPDFIFANALQVVVAHEAQGYIPLVKGGGSIRAVLFVRKDSPVQRADELAEKRIAFVGDKNL